MKKTRLIRMLMPVALLVSIGMLLQSCAPDSDCEENMLHPVRISFVQLNAATNRLQPIQVDSITVLGINSKANPLYDNKRRLRTIELPLMPIADSTGFVIQFPGTHRDTVWISHSHQFHLVSPECGFTVFFHVEGIRHTSRIIRDFIIQQPFVSSDFEEHISLVIAPATGN